MMLNQMKMASRERMRQQHMTAETADQAGPHGSGAELNRSGCSQMLNSVICGY